MIAVALLLGVELFVSSCGSSPEAAQPPSIGSSATCGAVSGKTPKDLANLTAFCANGIAKGAVVSADAMDSLLWLTVSRPMADQFRADKLSAEQLVKTWMRGWRMHSGQRVVSVQVKLADVVVANGDTTFAGEDRISIK